MITERSPKRNLKEESEPIFSTVAVESGTHYDSLRAEMLWMMSESDIRASVRCHGDAQPNVTELRVQYRWKGNERKLKRAQRLLLYCHYDFLGE